MRKKEEKGNELKKEETSAESTSEQSTSEQSTSEQSDESNKTDRKETKSEVAGANIQRKGGSHVAPDQFNYFYCEQTFSTPNSLRYHLDYVHPWKASSEEDSETKNEDVSSTEEMENTKQEDIVDIRNITKPCMDIGVMVNVMKQSLEKSEEFSRSRKDIEDLEVKEKEELTEKKGEESEEKKENENEEVTVNVTKQCLEENQEFSPSRKDNTTEDIEVNETQEFTKNEEEKSEEKKENEKERTEVVDMENKVLTEKKKENSKEKNEKSNESSDTSIVKVTNLKLLTLKDMPTRRHNETRGQFMCRLALQIKKHDNWYMAKEDVQSDTSYSDLTSGDDADISDDVAEDTSVK